MLEALREHFAATARRWWAIVPLLTFGLIGTVLDLQDAVHDDGRFLVPLWAWVAIALSGIPIAQFLAWRELRSANIDLQKQLDDLLSQPHLWVCEMIPRFFLGKDNGNSAIEIALVLENTSGLRLKYDVKRLGLQVDGRTSPYKPQRAGGYLHPGRTTQFLSPRISGIDYSKLPLSGELEVEIGYATVPSSRDFEPIIQKFTLSIWELVGEGPGFYMTWLEA